jgi:drug/metabolite transporter (DMT)-like permease
VLLIKGFNASVSWWLLGLGIASAILSALAYNMVRTLREKEHPLVVVLHFQLFGWVAGAGFSLYDFRMPEGMEWALLLLMGLFTQWGQENLTRSLQAEPANKVTILNYTGVLYAMLFGYLLFDETYGWPELLGTLLVISGMTLNILIENSKKRASL